MIRPHQFIPDQDIEEAANAMLRGFCSAYGEIFSPPIPIEKMVEQYLDLRIDWDTIEDSEEQKILGLLHADSKKIIMNDKHRGHFQKHMGTEAYTMAHELGHWDLHIVKQGEPFQLPLIGDSRTYLCREGKFEPREFQAERYAAYLLMPKDLVFNAVEGIDLARFSNLYSLKDQFGVTITAFTRRLKDLHLIYEITDDKKIILNEHEGNPTLV